MKKKIKALTTKSMEKASIKIPPRLSVYVSETRNDMKRFIMIGFLSFILTVSIIFFAPKIPRLISTASSLFPKQKINLDKIFLSAGEQTVDPLLVKSVIDEKDITWVFVDYRSPVEFNASHIKGAINIPLYTDYKKYLETSVPLSTWYDSYWKIQKWGKKVLLYGYWDKSKMSTDLSDFLNKKGERFYLLKMGFYEFKNDFYQWAPGGDINDGSVASYLEGSLIVPPRIDDGVPPFPTTK